MEFFGFQGVLKIPILKIYVSFVKLYETKAITENFQMLRRGKSTFYPLH